MSRVFVSYSHESDAHRQRVLALVQELRRRGVDAWIDLFESIVPDGWPAWMRRQVEAADHVLLVCTPTYVARFEGSSNEGSGVTWEGFLVRQLLYDGGGRNTKVIAGWFDPTKLPRDLRQYRAVHLDDLDGLMRILGGRPQFDPHPLGGLAVSEPRSDGMGPEPDAASRLDLAYDRRRALRERGTTEGLGVLDEEIVRLAREARGECTEGAGTVLGPWRLVAPIGEGGFATVWRAVEELEFGEIREVALKVLHSRWRDAPTYVSLFRKGAAQMASLNGPYTVPVLRTPGAAEHYYAMDLMPGGNLHDAVLSGRLGVGDAMRVALDAGRALIAAHARSRTHGDVKPHNILLDADGHGRLTDFDLVRVMGMETAQQTRALGTISYVAPEIESPPHRGDARSDVYGLAMVLAFCAARRPLGLRDGGNPERLLARLELAEPIRRALARALAEDPADRTATVAELVAQVEPEVAEAQRAGRARPSVPRAVPVSFSRTFILRDAAPLEMVEIPAGTFTMGSPPGVGDSDERPAHSVTLTRSLRVGVTAVTQAQWRALARFGLPPNPSLFQGDRHPVERVSWWDAVRWCNALSQQEGRRPAYTLAGERCVGIDLGAGYRLPTEAEWEYFARAGTNSNWTFGDDPAELADHGWYARNADPSTHAVALLEPNAWGLYDVHGNVWEWCCDAWCRKYDETAVTDPLLAPVEAERRVYRGGAWPESPRRCRSGYRAGNHPDARDEDLGFRIVLPI